MSDLLVPTVRAIVREELAGRQQLALGEVTAIYTDEGGSGDSRLEIDLRLRGSALELPRVPLTVARRGLSLAPRIGDLAVVSFVTGELEGALVLGFLYDHESQPPQAKAEEVVYTVPDDGDAETRRLAVELPNGHTLTLTDEALTITMGSTSIEVEADGAVAVKAGGDLSLEAGGKITISAGGDVEIAGVNITSEAKAASKVKGATVGIAGMTDFSAS
ncbi:MAG: hypothetical protein AAGD38_03180 [Acidobacteriota bacterium]